MKMSVKTLMLVAAVAALLAAAPSQGAGARQVLQSTNTGLCNGVTLFSHLSDPLLGKSIWLDFTKFITSILSQVCSRAVQDPLCSTCNLFYTKCTSCVDATADNGVKYSLINGVCSLKLTWEEFTAVNGTNGGQRFATFDSYGGLNFTSVNPTGGIDSKPFAIDIKATALTPAFVNTSNSATSGIRVMYLFNASSTYTLRISPTKAGQTFKAKSLNIFNWQAGATVTFTARLSGQTVATYTVSFDTQTASTPVTFPASFSSMDELILTGVGVTPPNGQPQINLLIDDLVYVPNVPYSGL